LPPTAVPVTNDISPELPELEVPEVKLMAPLTPAVPASNTRMMYAPEVEGFDIPLAISILPPVKDPIPASTSTSPPMPKELEPTTRLTSPALPLTASPVPS
jgi:hypothetical protein